jgi:hypothetical protein
VTKRKKKILIIQIFIFLFTILLIYSTYRDKNIKVEIIDKKIKQEETAGAAINVFEDVEYKGIDLNGNRYVVKSKIADFDLETPEKINMTIMSATFYFKDGTTLTVNGDKGNYNNKTLDMQFRDNIKAVYLTNIIFSDKLDYVSKDSLVTISGNVIGESIQGDILADKVVINLINKNINASMFDEKKIKVKLKENEKRF